MGLKSNIRVPRYVIVSVSTRNGCAEGRIAIAVRKDNARIEDNAIGIRYTISELFTRRTWAPYVLLLAAAILLVLVGGLAFQYGRLVMLADLDAGTLSLLEAIDWSFMHMLDPGTLGAEEYEHRYFYISGILITLLGIIITSILIGLISSSFTDRMDSLRQGATAVRERDHILLLGWSMQALSIVQYFMTRNIRRKVVILSQVLPDDIDLSLRRVGLQRSKLPLVIRTGDSTVADELDRVAVKNAAAIIVVGAPGDSPNSADVDATVLKTIMTIKSHLATTEMPNMVAEISDRAHRDVAEVVTGHKIPYLIRRDIESRLLVQLCRYPGLGYVLGALWGDSDFKITLYPVRDFSGTTFAEVTQIIEGAAVIGISWKESDDGEERDAIVLNPPADYDLENNDSLILVTSSNDRVSETHAETPANCVERMSNDRRYGQYPRRLLILGCNWSIDEILIEYDTYAFRGGEIHILASERQIDGIDLDIATLSNTAVHYHIGDTRRRDALVSMDLNSFDVIMVLAELEHTDTNDDAITILTLLLLNGILGDRPRPNIICEINNKANRDLIVPDLADDLIVSPEVISVQLARISEQPLLGAISRELSSAGGVELALRTLHDYGLSDDDVSYGELQFAAQANDEVAIGILDVHASNPVAMYPTRETRYSHDANIRLIVLAHHVFA